MPGPHVAAHGGSFLDGWEEGWGSVRSRPQQSWAETGVRREEGFYWDEQAGPPVLGFRSRFPELPGGSAG